MEETLKTSGLDTAKSARNNSPQQKIGKYLRLLLASLLLMFITGVGMVAIGQPSSTHIISKSGNTFWHVLFVIHMVFLALMTINALLVLATAIRSLTNLKRRAGMGIAVIVLGSVCGSLSFQGIHPALFLFCVALSFLALGAIYGPLLGQMMTKKN